MRVMKIVIYASGNEKKKKDNSLILKYKISMSSAVSNSLTHSEISRKSILANWKRR